MSEMYHICRYKIRKYPSHLNIFGFYMQYIVILLQNINDLFTFSKSSWRKKEPHLEHLHVLPTYYIRLFIVN